jgi:hypothetical protein
MPPARGRCYSLPAANLLHAARSRKDDLVFSGRYFIENIAHLTNVSGPAPARICAAASPRVLVPLRHPMTFLLYLKSNQSLLPWHRDGPPALFWPWWRRGGSQRKPPCCDRSGHSRTMSSFTINPSLWHTLPRCLPRTAALPRPGPALARMWTVTGLSRSAWGARCPPSPGDHGVLSMNHRFDVSGQEGSLRCRISGCCRCTSSSLGMAR